MSEKNIMEGIQKVIQALPEFDQTDVTINDWSILDGARSRSPFLVLYLSDDFDSRQDATTPVTDWNIKGDLYEPFLDWEESMNSFRDKRQAIIDKLNLDDNRSAGGLDAVTIDRIRSGESIQYLFPFFLDPEQLRDSLPEYIKQTLIFEAQEY